MEQPQHGFSDSTPRVGSDRLQKPEKVKLIKLAPKSMGHFDTF